MSEALNYQYKQHRDRVRQHRDDADAPSAVSRIRTSSDLELMEAFLRARIVVVDAMARVQLISDKARVLLSGSSGLQLRDGCLRVERASVQRRLTEILANLTLRGDGVGSAMLGVPDNDGRIRFALKAMRIPGDAGDYLAILAVVDLLNEDNVSRDTVASLFGLSEREAELADYFSRGLRVEEIAREMGVTANTARVHLRSVFNKTGCTSQVELARLIALIP